MRVLILIVSLLYINSSFGQSISEDNLVFWSETKKLTVDDFGIKTQGEVIRPAIAQFSIDYAVNGFDFLTKNFNKKVRCYMIKSASVIDTTANVASSLRYEQTLFDICELYVRQFRKTLKENRKKIVNGLKVVEELSQINMSDFANRRTSYDMETNSGTIEDKLSEWELQIKKELGDLKEFAY